MGEKGLGGVREGEKRGGKRDSQGVGKWEEKGKITQHCAIFRNQNMQRGGSQQIRGGNRD